LADNYVLDISFLSSAAFGIQYPQYSQYHFSISEAKPTTSIFSENIEKDLSIPNTALFLRNRAIEWAMVMGLTPV
jgi:hypothetical protein